MQEFNRRMLIRSNARKVWTLVLMSVMAVLLVVREGQIYNREMQLYNCYHDAQRALEIVKGEQLLKLQDQELAFATPRPKPKKIEKLFNIGLPFYESQLTEDFPTIPGGRRKIPLILHQTYLTESIPEVYVENIRSFFKHNPDIIYYFWTEETARSLILEKYPDFIEIWEDYTHPIYRADALRYFVLYHYGGIYADLDVKCHKPLDRILKKYSAIIPLEPFEHSVFRIKIPFLASNAIMLTAPRHKFFKYMSDTLKGTKNSKDMLIVAGPVFVTQRLISYNGLNKAKVGEINLKVINKSSTIPYHLQGKFKFPLEHKNAVFVPNTNYFLNTLADNFNRTHVNMFCDSIARPNTTFKNSTHCLSVEFSKVCYQEFKGNGDFWRRACNELRRRETRDKDDIYRFVYLEHLWYSSYFETKVDLNKTVKILSVVPKAKIYNGS